MQEVQAGTFQLTIHKVDQSGPRTRTTFHQRDKKKGSRVDTGGSCHNFSKLEGRPPN